MGTPTNLRSQIMDPLLNFKFIVNWGDSGSGKVAAVAGVSKVSALSRNVEPADYREGADPFVSRKIPGQVKYDNITLERGIILDIAFEQWANKIWYYEQTGALSQNQVSLADFRKDLRLDVCNQAGQIMLQYWVFNAWPTKYQALPELDAQAGNTVALETLELAHEGWTKDTSYSPAKYPSYALPTDPTGGKPPS
jgi:phage tail-like protein